MKLYIEKDSGFVISVSWKNQFDGNPVCLAHYWGHSVFHIHHIHYVKKTIKIRALHF